MYEYVWGGELGRASCDIPAFACGTQLHEDLVAIGDIVAFFTLYIFACPGGSCMIGSQRKYSTCVVEE